MAIITILMGCMLGFLSAVTAFFGFDATMWMSLGIWIAAGPTSVLMVIAVSTFSAAGSDNGPILAKVA